MIIKTKEDWIELAKRTAPKMPEYMSQHGNGMTSKVEEEMTKLVDAEDWKKLHSRFEEIWSWLPDRSDIRHHPFSDLCDLCSEGWALYEDEAAS